MKKILAILAMLPLAIAAFAQESALSISELPNLNTVDKALGTNAQVNFLSANNNLVVTSSNKNDEVKAAVKQNDGKFVVKVLCDMSNKSADSKRKFTVKLSGTSQQESMEKILTAGKNFFFEVVTAEHQLCFNFPQNTSPLYKTSEKKSCVEINVPQDIGSLHLRFTEGIGRQLTTKSSQGYNILALEIDCAQLTAFFDRQKKAEDKAREAEVALATFKAEFEEKMNDDGFDFDAAEAHEAELKAAADKAVADIPTFYITLSGDKTNTIDLADEKDFFSYSRTGQMEGLINNLLTAKSLVTVGVDDVLRKEIRTVATTEVAEKLNLANNAYNAGQFKTAASYYQQALESKEATDENKTEIQAFLSRVNDCSAAQIEANKVLTLLKNYKDNGKDVNPDEVVALYDVAIANYKTIYSITRNDRYQQRIEALEKSRAKIGYVMSGTVISTDFKQGQLMEEAITGIEIYGVSAKTKDMMKGVHGVHVGTVDPAGKFHVEVPREEYEGLLFVPSGNKKFSKNVYQTLRGKKHLDIKVVFSRD